MENIATEKKTANKISKERIWELDALRGILIIGVIFVHLIFDLDYFFGIIDMQKMPKIFTFIQENGGILFIVLSGICITLGSKCIKRGLFVLAGAIIVTLVSIFIGTPELYIFFGILHLLAFCMLTYPLYKKASARTIFGMSIIAISIGILFENIYISSPYWFWLGAITRNFFAGDFFPVFPNVGYFMLGIVIGRTVYKDKKTLLPRFHHNNFIIKFLAWCGRNSLFIYLGHQPILYGNCMLINFIQNK